MKSEIRAIVEGLLKKSREDKVAWVHASTVGRLTSEEGVDPSSEDYAVNTPSYTINVFKTIDISPSGPKRVIRINILNELGDVVTNHTANEDEKEYPMMEELIELARNSVIGEERVLKKIMEGLSKPGIFGSTDDEVPF
jgi:hypothetical protein